MKLSARIGKQRLNRRFRVRNRIRATATRPRLTVFRSNKHIYVQIICDKDGKTLVSASTVEKQALADVLRQLKREGLSILLVEHDMDFVMGLTDRIVVMEFGTRLIEGTPAEVQASPAVRAAYLGTEH